MEFDMVGIDASIANAFRRILLAEVKFNKELDLRVKKKCRKLLLYLLEFHFQNEYQIDIKMNGNGFNHLVMLAYIVINFYYD